MLGCIVEKISFNRNTYVPMLGGRAIEVNSPNIRYSDASLNVENLYTITNKGSEIVIPEMLIGSEILDIQYVNDSYFIIMHSNGYLLDISFLDDAYKSPEAFALYANCGEIIVEN